MDISTTERGLIERAGMIVGVNSPPSNTSIRAGRFEQSHAAYLEHLLPDSAPLLAILKSAPIRNAAASYHTHQQSSYRHLTRYKLRSVLIPMPLVASVVLSILYLYLGAPAFASLAVSLQGAVAGVAPSPSAAQSVEVAVRQWVPWLVLGGICLTPILSHLISPDAACADWMRSRASAEEERRKLFEGVMAAKQAEDPAEKALDQLLRLEYFRRWQIEVQSAYFRSRRAQDERKVRHAEVFGKLCAAGFIVFLLVAMAGSFGSQDEQGPTAFIGSELAASGRLALQKLEQYSLDRSLLLAALLSTLAAAVLIQRQMLSQSVRNAARYGLMETRFQEIQGWLEKARIDAANGDAQAVRTFVDRVHATMSLELSDWIRLADLDAGRESAHSFRTPPQAPEPDAEPAIR